MSNDGHNGAGRSLADAVTAGPTRTGPISLAEARRAVEHSRDRISATLNELEDRIIDTKESIKRKADVVRPAREAIRRTPLIALGVAVAVGLLLGARGGKQDDEDDDGYGFDRDERKALEEWRKRRRKLLMNEAEEAGEAFEEESSGPGPVRRFFGAIGHEVAGVAIGIIAAEVAERYMGGRDEEDHDDVEERTIEDELDAVYDND
ncbi:MAG: hypothetical protein ABIV28_06155 [Longimicrobiales bacterium]